MKYKEAYVVFHNVLKKKEPERNEQSGGLEMVDFVLHSNNPSVLAHRSYMQVLSIYMKFFNEVYDSSWTLKVDPEADIPVYWEEEIAELIHGSEG